MKKEIKMAKKDLETISISTLIITLIVAYLIIAGIIQTIKWII